MTRRSLLVLLVLSACPLVQLASAEPAARVLPQPTVDVAGSSAGSVAPEPVKPRAKPTRRLVYSCATPSLVTFSDRPCGVQAVVRELTVQPALTAAGAAPAIVASRLEPLPARSSAGDAAANAEADAEDEIARHDEACRKLQARLDQVDSQMRAGYAAGQAGRLWDRWRDAKQRLRESRC